MKTKFDARFKNMLNEMADDFLDLVSPKEEYDEATTGVLVTLGMYEFLIGATGASDIVMPLIMANALTGREEAVADFMGCTVEEVKDLIGKAKLSTMFPMPRAKMN